MYSAAVMEISLKSFAVCWWQDGSTAMSVAMEAGNRDVGVLLYAHAERLKSASVINEHDTSSSVNGSTSGPEQLQ